MLSSNIEGWAIDDSGDIALDELEYIQLYSFVKM